MKILTMLVLALPLALALNGCTNDVKHKPVDNSFVLKNIHIIDVENQTILPAKNIVVNNGKIDFITDDLSTLTLSNTPVIDGQGGYVTPGLIDMHVHMYEKAAYVLTLSHGVTHVRIMNGIPEQLKWREQIDSGLLIGSTSTVSSPIISGDKNAYLHHDVDTAKQAKAAVRKYQSMGYDFIKAYGSLNKEALLALVEEGKKLAMPIAKHGPHASGDLPMAKLSGLQSFEHVEDIYQGPLNYQFAPEQLPAIIADLKSTDVPVTPTLNIFYQLTKLSQEKEAYLAKTSTDYTSDIIALETSVNQVKRWLNASEKMAAHNQKTLAFLLLITNSLHDSGVPLLVGSDSGVLLSPHGLATHTEMSLLKKSGLTTFDVLAAATINPAKALNLETQIGKVSKNYKADFIYSTSNPIEDLTVLTEPEAVIKSGYWYSKDTLITMRNEAIESRSFWEEFGVLFEAL